MLRVHRQRPPNGLPHAKTSPPSAILPGLFKGDRAGSAGARATRQLVPARRASGPPARLGRAARAGSRCPRARAQEGGAGPGAGRGGGARAEPGARGGGARSPERGGRGRGRGAAGAARRGLHGATRLRAHPPARRPAPRSPAVRGLSPAAAPLWRSPLGPALLTCARAPTAAHPGEDPEPWAACPGGWRRCCSGCSWRFLLMMGVLFCCGAGFFIRRRMYPPPLIEEPAFNVSYTRQPPNPAPGGQQPGLPYYTDPGGPGMNPAGNPMAMAFQVQPNSPQGSTAYPPPPSYCNTPPPPYEQVVKAK
uniref:WW domain binding protein VOPP1 n=1 Tax=Canis lupus familiaris TaxID=9615 RepID=A0A8C0QKF0_CANLF